jgi:hypothetical protein
LRVVSNCLIQADVQENIPDLLQHLKGSRSGFIHVFDEISLDIIRKELDTISDFIEYLSAKECFYASGKKTPFLSGEENLLALYLNNGRKLPDNYDTILLEDDLWKEFIKKPGCFKKKEEDKNSYIWDKVIEDIAKYILNNNLEFSTAPGDGEPCPPQ